MDLFAAKHLELIIGTKDCDVSEIITVLKSDDIAIHGVSSKLASIALELKVHYDLRQNLLLSTLLGNNSVDVLLNNILEEWKNREAENATLKKLCNAFLANNLRFPAELLVTHFTNSTNIC